MVSRQDPAALQNPQWGMAEGGRGEVRPYRHPDGSNGARPKHCVIAHREYGLLSLVEPAGNPDAAEPQGRGESPEDITGTGERNRKQCAPCVRPAR